MQDNDLIIYKNSDGNIVVDAIYKDEAKERHIMTMQDWINATDGLLKFRRKNYTRSKIYFFYGCVL